MTVLLNRPEDFATEALAGFVAAHRHRVRAVSGGVVRREGTRPNTVAVVLGGGAGHYPAFAGWVGPGFAHGAVCGHVFASPSAGQVYSVARAADAGAGVLLGFGNYAGDVLQFGAAAARLRAEGVRVGIVTTTDDVASFPSAQAELRRGIAGNLAVFKIVAAAAEAGLDLPAVEAVGRRANAATRTLGVAFDGCTLPGAPRPLFEVLPGQMAVGLGIHGEAGLRDQEMLVADDLADLLVEAVLAEAPQRSSGPDGWTGRVAVLVNGLGTVTDEELFLLYRRVSSQLQSRGLAIVGPEVGRQVTSLDMSGLSLSLTFLDAELEAFWTAPTSTPAFTRESARSTAAARDEEPGDAGEPAPRQTGIPQGSASSRRCAARVTEALRLTREVLLINESALGDLDAVAGDGDHGIGMVRGATGALEAAQHAFAAGAGSGTVLQAGGAAWADHGGGTSGALWGAALIELGLALGDTDAVTPKALRAGIRAAVATVERQGGACLGDKTLLDAALPFIATLESEMTAGAVLGHAWAQAADRSTEAARATQDIPARRGRAHAHGARSIGTPDPGATSFALVVSALTSLCEESTLVEQI